MGKKMMEPVFDVTPATSFENFSGTKQQKCFSSEYQDQMLRIPRKTFTIFVTELLHLTLFANILLVLVSSKNDVFGVTSHRSELAANRLRLVTCKNTKTSSWKLAASAGQAMKAICLTKLLNDHMISCLTN